MPMWTMDEFLEAEKAEPGSGDTIEAVAAVYGLKAR